MNSNIPALWLSRLLQRIGSSTVATRIFPVLLTACFALGIIGWLIPHHDIHAGESSVGGLVGNIPGFYGAYGFFMCALMVLVAKALRRLIMRPDGYYAPFCVDNEVFQRENDISEDEKNAS